MKRKAIIAAGAALTLAGCASFEAAREAQMREQATAWIKRDFQTLGIAAAERVNQDEAQRLCDEHKNMPPREIGAKIEAAQLAAIKMPAGGKVIGDWKSGQRIAQAGGGMTWTDKAGTPNGGNCYNCHQLSKEELSFGTLGPSLHNYGKLRAYNEAIATYAYQKIYNSQAFNACSNMPRLGHHGVLTESQIKDLVAYLMDPNSPVNK